MGRRKRKHSTPGKKPRLGVATSLADFREHYWLKEELVAFAKELGLAIHGDKPALSARIERRLRKLPDAQEAKPAPATGRRDSERRLTRGTRVVHYKSDAATRAFFEAQIGQEFHFTYHLNQFRLRNPGLSYGDLVDEWVAERDRRRSKGYTAPIAEHGKYNRFVRDFFADPKNRGKSLRDASVAWNAIKDVRGGARYERRKK